MLAQRAGVGVGGAHHAKALLDKVRQEVRRSQAARRWSSTENFLFHSQVAFDTFFDLILHAGAFQSWIDLPQLQISSWRRALPILSLAHVVHSQCQCKLFLRAMVIDRLASVARHSLSEGACSQSWNFPSAPSAWIARLGHTFYSWAACTSPWATASAFFSCRPPGQRLGPLWISRSLRCETRCPRRAQALFSCHCFLG